MRNGAVNCGCRVLWSEVVAVLGLPPGAPPTDRVDCSADWAGRPSLSIEAAGRFVREYREELAAKQQRQDELTASRATAAAARQNAEAAFWAAEQRQAQREAAIRKGAARAVDSLTGLVTAEKQEQAYLDGAELAAELFDKQHPVPA